MSQSSSSGCEATFSTIITEIETSICKSKNENLQPAQGLVRYHKRWTTEEKQILAKLVKEYGSDFTYFKRFLPFKTRRQIQRGYEAQATRELHLRKIIQTRERKDHFDVQVLDGDSYCQTTQT